MVMSDHTNPRKLTTSGGMRVVSFPRGFWEECGLEQGDRVVLYPADEGFEARKVSLEVSDR